MNKIIFINLSKKQIKITVQLNEVTKPLEINLSESDIPIVRNTEFTIKDISAFDYRDAYNNPKGSSIVIWAQKKPTKTPDLNIIGVEIKDGVKLNIKKPKIKTKNK